MGVSLRIRAAGESDVAALADLAGQLGYPCDVETMRTRYAGVAAHGGGAVLLAEQADGRIAGWAHVHPRHSLTDAPSVELAGLVVDARCRGAGVGAALLAAVEAWARTRGYAGIVVRSNVLRERAHRFYLREGYREVKRQAVFRKALREND